MVHIKQMSSVALKVRGLKRSMDWYGKHFGFEYRHKAEGCVVMGVRDIEMVLSPHHNPEAPLANPKEVRCIHTLGFEIPETEFHKLRDEFSEDADIVEFDQEEFRSIITSDPDGYCVELYYNKQPNLSKFNSGRLMTPKSENCMVRALTFDVFGTVVDWRSSIVREGQLLTEAKGVRVDWGEFADAWRDGYGPAMDRVRKGELPWTNVDGLHRLILDGLLAQFQITGLTAEEVDHLNRVWHRLTPWPDAVPGLHRLRSRYVVAALSNGNLSLLVNMAKNAGLPWDCVLSAELSGHYKPDREVYETAAHLLDLSPAEVMMVAAHKGDLRAAKGVGFKTAWVPRLLEHGPDQEVDTAPDPSFDVTASDFLDLAVKLGA